MLGLANEQPDLTLDEFCAVLKERKITTSRVSIWRFFCRHGLSFKKILHASEQERANWPKRASAGGTISPPLMGVSDYLCKASRFSSF